MQCPFCQTENREDRERCYACDKDISMLRLLVNKARHHYNDALEHAERGRTIEAIDELRNALDLDRRFTNAHVVLGTLYAKEGEYEKAREAWSNALEINPELSKAHSYLQKVHQVEGSLPALKTYRRVAAGLLLLVVLLAAGLLYLLRPDPAVRRLSSARQMYSQQKYGKALKELEQVRRSSDSGSPVNIAADAMRLALKMDLNQQVRDIQAMKFNNRYADALAAIASLESALPDNETSAKLALLRQDIAHYYREEIDKLYLDYETSMTDYARLRTEIEKFLDLYPELPEKEFIREYLTKGADAEASREIGNLRSYFAESRDYLGARRRLSELVAQFPQSEKLAGGRTDLVDEIFTWMFEAFHTSVQERRFADAEELLLDIEDTIPEFRDIVDVSGPADLARRVLADARKTAQRKDIEDLLKAGQFEEADLALFFYTTEDELSPVEQDLAASYHRQIQENRAKQQARATHERMMKLFIAPMDDAQASSVLVRLQETLTTSTEAELTTESLVKVAVAAAKLNNQEVLTSATELIRNSGVDQQIIYKAEELSRKPAAKPTPQATTATATRRATPTAAAIKIEPSDSTTTRTGSRSAEETPASRPRRRPRQ